MRGLHHLAIWAVAVVVAGGLTAFFVGDRSPTPIKQTDPPVESPKEPIKRPNPRFEYTDEELAALMNDLFDDSPQEPFALDELPDNIREMERSRRAMRPSEPNRKTIGRGGPPIGAGYDWVSGERKTDDGISPSPIFAELMPPTSCRSVEPAPKHPENTSGPHWVHALAVADFEVTSGFGYRRMLYSQNKRGKSVSSGVIDRVELVSLLTEDEPSVYVLDMMATPPRARLAKRRPLDEFERLALDAVRRGELLVWTPEAPTRMFGAIRAKGLCLECHPNAKRGDLLGAFTYYLETPVDELAKRGSE